MKLDGEHRVRGMVPGFARVLETQQVCGQGQGTAVGGINDQEFFFYTKSTH